MRERLKEFVLISVLKTLKANIKNKRQAQMLGIKLIDDHGVIMRFSIRLSSSNVNSDENTAENRLIYDDVKENDADEQKDKSSAIPLSKIFGCIESVKAMY